MQQSLPSPSLLPYWRAYQDLVGSDINTRFYESFYFADSEDVANQLAELVLAGIKTATAALVWGLEAQGKQPPKIGDLSIVTNWKGEPQCIIETISTVVLPFEEVCKDFAAAEGEGDKSLEYWRKVHWDYFSRECGRIGKTPTQQMHILCERFKVVYIQDA